MFYKTFKRDLDASRRRLEGAGGRLAITELGPIEYVEAGEGPPVLIVHGVIGGCDHGAAIARSYLGDGFRTISVSRFGYLRSPLLEERSAAAQADIYAALLDVLGIDKVALLATSAGTSSALQFALGHPNRTYALALFSMAVPPYAPVPGPALFAMRRLFASDFLWWTASRYTPLVRRLMGVNRDLEGTLSAADEAFVSDLKASFLPVSRRAPGIMNDVLVANPDLNNTYPLEGIRVPSLIFHSRDDNWGDFYGARSIASRIPNARFETIDRGGHLLLGHRDAVKAEVGAFVRERATASRAA